MQVLRNFYPQTQCPGKKLPLAIIDNNLIEVSNGHQVNDNPGVSFPLGMEATTTVLLTVYKPSAIILFFIVVSGANNGLLIRCDISPVFIEDFNSIQME